MGVSVLHSLNSVKLSRPLLSAESAVAAAKQLAPTLAKRSLKGEELRQIPPETIDDLQSLGLLGLMQPKAFGGSELGLGVLMDVVLELCKGCGSSGWVFSNLASHSWNIGQFELQAQNDVWLENPSSVVATALAFPCGRATPVEGGYILSGRWPFASGVDASQWMLVGGMAERDGGPAERRFFLVPESDYQNLGNWDAYGLRATGSHDVEMKEAFVPKHRSISAELIASGQNLPGAKLYKNPLFQTPAFAAFAYVLGIVPLGIAKGAVEQFTQSMRLRVSSYTGVRVAELSAVQARIAEASACVDVAETVLRRDWTDLESSIVRGDFPTIETKLRWKRNVAFAAQLAVRSVDTLLPAAGASGLSSQQPLQRQFRDIHAAVSHIGLTWDVHASAYGQSALGLPLQGGLLL
jgi:3-hydroxy-9,10-secoandrosta-1,3,5(10)-triene-9,17-dione monooxygenase